MTTGERIKAARLQAGFTQSQLAKELNIPYQSIGQWERDLRNPKFETLKKIADVLGVSVAQLVSDEAIAEEKTAILQQMMEYLDAINLALDQDESDKGHDQYQIVSADHGTIALLDYSELQSLFESILKDANARKEKYIINRLKAEFDGSEKK